VAYSIAIDESTDVKNIAQLAVFVRGVNENFELMELIELVPMKGKTGADEIVSQLVTLLNKFELPWGKMVGENGWLVSDGVPAMIGNNNKKRRCNQKKSRERVLSIVSTVFFINMHCMQRA
jgi:hypothetical protein